ncbi:CPBP family intramembrane metalloprotease, partial [Pseudomonas aeruginosa]|nr:CPBP family intramembrane metalloprotease [Pseudomonas aeruginosa]
MWFLLATSLLALSFQRLLALALLLATCCLAFYDGVLAPPAVAALAVLGVLALLRRRLAARRAWALGLELLL